MIGVRRDCDKMRRVKGKERRIAENRVRSCLLPYLMSL